MKPETPPPELVHAVQTGDPVIALTFDDGPDPEYTPQILDVLRRWNVSATFYMIGEQIEKCPEIARAVADQGHEIGNHTYSHPFLTRLSEEDRLRELRRTEDRIREWTGRVPATFRPPYLDYDGNVARAAARFGYRSIGAVNLDARDWAEPGTDHIVRETRRRARRGSILIFHDGWGPRSQTVEAISILVPELVLAGYRLVTVSELLDRHVPGEGADRP